MTYRYHLVEFSTNPGGRVPRDGEHNATTFREDILKPLLKKHDKVEIHLDGIAGLGYSWIEEVFTPLSEDHKSKVSASATESGLLGDVGLIEYALEESKKKEDALNKEKGNKKKEKRFVDWLKNMFENEGKNKESRL